MAAKRGGSPASSKDGRSKPKSPSKKKTSKKATKRGFGTGAGRQTKWTTDARARFLAELRDHAMVSIAAAAIGMSRSRMYELRKEDEGFAEDWDNAIEESYDRLEEEARRRAEQGVLKPIYQQGRRVGHVREYSDSLMSLVLRARRRKVYSEKAQQGLLDGQDAGTGVLKVGGTLSEDEWEETYGEKAPE